MSMPYLIIGGGLAGLVTAYELEKKGIPWRLLEARSRLGGRILTVNESGRTSLNGFDLGASWCWPSVQPCLDNLLKELNLSLFPQFSEGDVLFHRMSRENPQRYRSVERNFHGMRLRGGSSALISALYNKLPAENFIMNANVHSLILHDGYVNVCWNYLNATDEFLQASHVILAMPPRLIKQNILFSPPLSLKAQTRLEETPTWMAPHAKFISVYDKPFWRQENLSGSAQSMAGILIEIHDATTDCGKAALMGFFAAPAPVRSKMGEDKLRTEALSQFVRLFGKAAASPLSTLFIDWSAENLTSTLDDQVAGMSIKVSEEEWLSGDWKHCVILAGSEVSMFEPGYLAGAVYAAQTAVGRFT